MLLSMSADVAMSQSDVVTDLGDVARPATFHSSLAALKPIILALRCTNGLLGRICIQSAHGYLLSAMRADFTACVRLPKRVTMSMRSIFL